MRLNSKIILVVIILLGCVKNLYSQEEKTMLNGKVQFENTNLQNINIINKATNLGTLSNSDGLFNIPASKGDTLLFSSMVHQNRNIIITEKHIKNKSITVYLEPGFNELDEVEILRKVRLEFRNVSVDRRTILDYDKITESAAPDVKKTFDYNTQLTNGVSFIGIYEALTKKTRERKNKERSETTRIARLKDSFSFKIKSDYGENFFVEWLNVPETEINIFLEFCHDNGLAELYNSNEFLIKNFLVLQSKKYLELKK